MDYSLEHLSPRSFEHLVQALALIHLSNGGLVFGDGPDGGREATFSGATSYDTGSGPWDGYVVVQAKFRQRSEGSATSDSDWFVRQLKEELAEYVKDDSTRTPPEYYLVVTNAVLSPRADTGGKDKALAAIQQSGLNLIGYDIWDYDKLCRLIDQSAEIRRTYAAWITPGDVLYDVIHGLGLMAPDFEHTLSRFLQAEMLADQFANLEQAGHSADERVPVARVFVDLPVTDLDGSRDVDDTHGFIRDVLDAAGEQLAPSYRQNGERSDAGDDPTSNGKLVLVGGPGQGKTTLGQFVCQLFRASILLGRDQASVADEVRDAVELVEKWCTDEGYNLPGVRRFPVRIVLSELAAALAASSGEMQDVTSLLTFLTRKIAQRTSTSLDEELFRAWLRAYPWLVVLDGLDEVPSSGNRDEVLTAIRTFGIEIADADADVLIIASTRPQGYSEEFNPRSYTHRLLAPLAKSEALRYADRLATVRFGENTERVERVLARLQAAAESETTARLMTSPLQVTIMTVLVDKRGHPPQERWSLFSAYYDVIYARELERDVPTALVLRDQKTNVDAIHRRVGLVLQAESETAGRADARLSVARFREIVQGRLSEEGFEGDRLAVVEAQIVEAAANRLVFLVGLQDDRVGFEIRSLQEFMAAEALMEGTDDLVWQRLAAIGASPSWRNVFLFASGKCFAAREHLRDVVYTICAQLNQCGDPALEQIKAGSGLALDVLEEGTVRQQPKYGKLFVSLALELLERYSDPGQPRLAHLYDDSYQDGIANAVKHNFGQPHFSQRLGTWTYLLALARKDVEWAVARCEREWPSAPEEGLELLSRVGHNRIISRRLSDVLGAEILRQPYWKVAEIALPVTQAMSEGQDSQSWVADLRAMLLHPGRSKTALQMRLGRDAVVSLSFPLLTLFSDVRGDALPTVTARHASWAAPKALSKFLLRPSPDSARNTLEAIAATLEPQDLPTPTRTAFAISSERLYCWYGWPWQITAPLFSATSLEDLTNRIERLGAGDYGTSESWEKLERDWIAGESDFLDWLSRFDPGNPLSPANEPPVAALHWSHVTSRPFDLTDELLQTVTALEPPARGIAADILLSSLQVHRLIGDLDGTAAGSMDHLCALADVADVASFTTLYLDLLEGALEHSEPTPAVRALLNRLGGHHVLNPYAVRRGATRLARALKDELADDGSRVGLTKLLAQVGSARDAEGIDLAGAGQGDEQLDFSVWLLSFDLSKDPPPPPANIVAMLAERPHLTDLVRESCRRAGASREWIEQLILGFLSELDETEHAAACAHLRELLADIVSGRLSAIAKPGGWESLELFSRPGSGQLLGA
jgi:hypothetical protein